MDKNKVAIGFAILAAALYAINVPLSKQLMGNVSPTMLAGFLYLGAGVGIGLMLLAKKAIKIKNNDEWLSKEDLPYTIAMVVLDIVAPILLMYGVANTTSANASLLNNFEIVATSVIALVLFKEKISKNLWTAILLVTMASAILGFEGSGSFVFNRGSLFVLGFVAYGLSINFYISAQKSLGAAKTSAFYSIAPFLGVAFSFLILGERPAVQFYIGLAVMLVSTVIMVKDTLEGENS